MLLQLVMGLVCLTSAGIIFFMDRALVPRENWFQDYLPEIFGLCLEGVAFVLILGGLQEFYERKRRNRLQAFLLRELSFLAAVIGNVLQSSEQSSELDKLSNGVIDWKNNRTIAETMKKFQNNSGNTNAFSKSATIVADLVLEKSLVHIARLRSAVPIAADLGSDFLGKWFRLIDALHALTQQEPFSTGKAEQDKYVYAYVCGLFSMLDEMNVPEYGSQ